VTEIEKLHAAEKLVRWALDHAVPALRFYAKADRPRDYDYTPGMRLEFGCGCCAGVVNEKGENDFDKDVQGLTAREALEKFLASGWML
jgi:hypothetical protein